MQKEIAKEATFYQVEILAVNMAADQGIAPPSDVALPMLQDTPAKDVWGKLGVTWRDVYVLDPSNGRQFVYNLTSFSLLDPNNYAFLKTVLLGQATPADANKNGLADDLEVRVFGEVLKAAPTRDQLLRVGFAEPGFAPSLRPKYALAKVENQWSLTRRAFGRLGPAFVLERSLDGKDWSDAPETMREEFMEPIFLGPITGLETWRFTTKDEASLLQRVEVRLGGPLPPSGS